MMITVQNTHQNNKEAFIIAGITALGGLLFGYNVGIIGIALLGLGKQFVLDVTLQQIITSSTILGALFGCMITQPVSDRLGYRPTIILVGLLFILGSLACALSPSISVLIVSRFILGLPIGGATQIIPVYIAEMAPPQHRGKNGCFLSINGCDRYYNCLFWRPRPWGSLALDVWFRNCSSGYVIARDEYFTRKSTLVGD